MEILEYIHVNLDVEAIERMLHMEKRGDWSQVQTLVEYAQSLITARAAYKVCYIESKIEDAITIDGTSLKSRVLRKNLDTVERVFPYVVTIGDKLEKKARAYDDLLKQYYFDTIGNVALTTVQEYLKDQLRSRYALDGMSYMNPGSLEDWPIEEQNPLFSILGDVEGSISVRLNENFLMIPNKSLSGIYFPTEIPFYSCQLCQREDCLARKTPYDEKLAREYGVLG
ncbi:MAG: vitamin B12 dependent methionine synthase [Deltaproteobacteria bacterium]|nr:vitamin B12 dependent methionine synthase [Deltaproteobacteria bacterium]